MQNSVCSRILGSQGVWGLVGIRSIGTESQEYHDWKAYCVQCHMKYDMSPSKRK